MLTINRSPAGIIFIILLMTLALSVGALFIGASSTSWQEMFFVDSHSHVVIFSLRLPRILLALAAGALLASSGAAMQGLFRNPLADPSLIGVTAGASFGGASAIFFGLQLGLLGSGNIGSFVVSIGACLGACLCVFLVLRLSRTEQGNSVISMLLTGIAITALAGSATSLYEYFSDDITLRRLSLWRMGSLDAATYQKLFFAVLVLLLCSILLQSQAKHLNALLLGEAEARHLGVNVQQSKIILIMTVALSTGVCVALCGAIAFIGLVVPHMLRLVLGPDHRFLLPASAVGGALLLVLADTLARTAFAPMELPVGLITALLGAPFFIALLRQRFRYGF